MNDEALEENYDEDDPDLDPHNHPDTDDDYHHQSADRIAHVSRAKEREMLVDGGVKICEFPVAVKRVVSKPYSSVFGIVEVERSAQNGESRGQGHSGVVVLENISHGQLQVFSAVPWDSVALLGGSKEETASRSAGASYVIRPPPIIAGSGVTKGLGAPVESMLCQCTQAEMPKGKLQSESDSWSSYPDLTGFHQSQCIDWRDKWCHIFSLRSQLFIRPKSTLLEFNCCKVYGEPREDLPVADCLEIVAGIELDDLTRIMRFFDHWGIINYCATPLKSELQKDGTYLCQDSNSELCVPSAALKSIDSLIQFDKPKCRLKATNVYPELGGHHDEDSNFDSTIQGHLSEHQCNRCSRPTPVVYYQ
ncbi:Hypothetical predicted protein [Olea europaea subsp. europaea]|uniref:SWIRM domain-containing protein n=1 Tax=Olea europaea subsp. europaea TaxID=158383 RepID=A0A8S0UST7_OLEEU|nr:Hypothetical predicted protein [Olea europaea subsp. europaea]